MTTSRKPIASGARNASPRPASALASRISALQRAPQACHRQLLSRSGLVGCVLAGEGEEDVFERRLGHAQAVDRDAALHQAPVEHRHIGLPVDADGQVTVAVVASMPSRRPGAAAARRRPGRDERRFVLVGRPQLVGRALEDDATVVDDADVGGKLLDLAQSRWLERKTVTPSCSGILRISSRISWMPAGSRPLVGSSRMSSSGTGKQRDGDAEPLAHALRVAAHRPVRIARSIQPDDGERPADLRGRRVDHAADHFEVLVAGQVRVEGRASRPACRRGAARPAAVRAWGGRTAGPRPPAAAGGRAGCGWWSSCPAPFGPRKP